ncbi:MAG: Holliday junction resolvase RuvX [Candidatus Aquicultor secundus]|nr:MAG: Holliday junction resolvase RuvX [Candidatus Aquicultor secundus]
MRILGVDYGLRRIGVAISDPTGNMAQPLVVIENRGNGSDIRRISQLVDEYKVQEVVVGLPVSMSGEKGIQAQAVLAYIEKLKPVLKVPVKTWDERLTTSFAERTLVESDVKRGRRKEIIDKVAAAIILQGYLDSKRAGEAR